MLLHHQLLRVARRNASHPALLHLGRAISYADLLQRVARLSYLYQAELGPKARVALFVSSSPAVVTSFLAITNSRTPILPLDPSLGFEELGLCLRQFQATQLAVCADQVAQAREVLRASRLSIPIIEIERKKGGEYDETYSPPPENPPKETDTVLLLRTAGTSGPSKWAAFDHKQLANAALSLQHLYRLTPLDRVTTPLNGSHPFAWMHGMLLPILTGMTCVIDQGLAGTEYASFLVEARVTRLLMDARSARNFLAICGAQDRRVPGLKALIVGPGAGPSVMREIRELALPLGIPVASVYGQTECGWAAAIEDPTATAGDGLRPLPAFKFKVLDENGDEVARAGAGGSRVGHLAISGPTIMCGYRGPTKDEAEKATRQAIRGTWLYTGDAAEISGEGESLRIRILGRKDELLPGTLISPEPIDAVARAIPGVQDAAGFVAKDAKGRPFMACAIVRDEGATLRESALLADFRRRFKPPEGPNRIVFTDFIPRAAVGGAANRLKLARQFEGLAPEAPPPDTGTAAPDAGPSGASLSADPRYATCDLAEILVNKPLPVTIHAYYKSKLVAFRPKGSQIDRATYDRLELKHYRQLYVLTEDLATLRGWRNAQEPSSEAGAQVEGNSDMAAARRGAHRDLLALLAGGVQDEFAARAVAISKSLVSEVAKSGGAIKSLRELQAYSRGTIEHSVNVSILATYFALHLGYEHSQILQHVGLGALLHDLGRVKLAIEEDESVGENSERTEQHPQVGADSLAADENISREVKLIVAQHHECYDGSGYPGKLKGARIYDLARIVSIADVFDNLVSRATGDFRNRCDWAFYKLEGEYCNKLDPFKVEKAMRLLRLSE